MSSRTAAVLVFACGFLVNATDARASFILAVTETPPGWDASYNGGVLLYEFSGTGPLQSLQTIPGRPQTLLNDPVSAAFDAHGELFVGNRHGNVGGGVGTIARFFVDASGNYVSNGSIAGNGLDAVHAIAFAPDGELFAANFRGDTISRFMFDDNGNAIPNGIIALDDGNYVLGLAFSPDGELFANDYAGIRRFTFDSDGAAIPNGSFTVPVDNPGFLAFSPEGELFVASHDDDTVLRFLFDAAGNPYADGTISVPGPFDFAFSPTGELFVSSHGYFEPIYDPGFGQISRFLFDENGNAIPNGTITTSSLGGLAIYAWSVPEPGTLALTSLVLAGLVLVQRRSPGRRILLVG
jgi:WD40 repeat protein